MNIHIWERLDVISGNWHSEGAVVAISESLDAARALFEREAGRSFGGSESDIFSKSPDLVVPCEATEERLFIFEDAGCC